MSSAAALLVIGVVLVLAVMTSAGAVHAFWSGARVVRAYHLNRVPDEPFESLRAEFAREVPAGTVAYLAIPDGTDFADVWRLQRLSELAAVYGVTLVDDPRDALVIITIVDDPGAADGSGMRLVVEQVPV